MPDFEAVPCTGKVEAIPCQAKGLWQNRAAIKCMIQVLEQSSKLQARGVAQEVTTGLLLAQTLL